MNPSKNKKLAYELSSISVFRGILKDECISALISFLEAEEMYDCINRYSEFVYLLSKKGGNLSEHLRKICFEDENEYIKTLAGGCTPSEALEKNVNAELSILSYLTHLDKDALTSDMEYEGYLASFDNEKAYLASEYAERAENISRYGYGIFTHSVMFRVLGNDIVPIDSSDSISFDKFVGYSDERQKVYDNTLALIEGRPAANVLLCGDAGTGKSSTVKAVANDLAKSGIRLIELRKDQLIQLPAVMERISQNPLKFIIFIDDLSFNKNDDCFSMLKAALEGSASAKTENAVIYATSNRRHIVKETFSDRGDDDIHRRDTVQELMSLSERFGLVVYFSKPDKALYLEIVRTLADRAGVDIDPTELDIKAEAYALAKGNRSPRAAEQFVNSLL